MQKQFTDDGTEMKFIVISISLSSLLSINLFIYHSIYHIYHTYLFNHLSIHASTYFIHLSTYLKAIVHEGIGLG